MKKERKSIPLSKLRLNTGQLDWLPKNPRQWSKADLDKMVASLNEDPDFMEDRPPLCVPFNQLYVVFGGNFRVEGEKHRKAVDTLECFVYTPETPADYEVIKRRAMKDNGTYGKWDYDTLANEWSDLPLGDWGVPAWDTAAPAPAPSQQPPIAGAENLPAELQGKDIDPDDLPKVQGDDEVAMERVIIVFPRERTAEMASLLGIPSIDKVVYNISELVPEE